MHESVHAPSGAALASSRLEVFDTECDGDGGFRSPDLT